MLNLKKCLVIYKKFKHITLKSKILKVGSVLAKDLIRTSEVSLVNPELKVFTVNKKVKLNFTLHLTTGRGFWLNNTTSFVYKNLNLNYRNLLFMDCLFSPVSSVKYSVNVYNKSRLYSSEELILEV
jgi:DNA-directed RNA polymerase alpha subunit